MSYLIIKTLHVISVIAWMAGLLYLPRLFVYHRMAELGSSESETFKVMERRLLRAIMYPALAIVWATGLALLIQGGWIVFGWLHIKLTAVVILTGVHVYLGRFVLRFAGDERPRSTRFFRFLNEVPTLLMIIAVSMVILKPF